MNVIYGTRGLLIRIGKVLPFIICMLVAVSYFESCVSLYNEDYILYDGYAILNKPISWFIGNYFEYNLQMLLVLFIISIAIETCIYNKLACMYLGVNLLEKDYFQTVELYEEYIYIVVFANIIVCGILLYNGFKRLK